MMNKTSVHMQPDHPVVYIRAVDPNDQATVAAIAATAKQNGEDDAMAGFTDTAMVRCLVCFDWLHYVCFCAGRGVGRLIRDPVSGHWDLTASEAVGLAEGWRTIHMQTRAAEDWIRNCDAQMGMIRYTRIKDLTQYLY
jgi:hypothetical protein